MVTRYLQVRPAGIKSCRACRVVRQLVPDKVAGSCDQCQPTDLLPANQEAWDIANRYPGIFTRSGLTGHLSVNYDAAREIAQREYVPDVLHFYQQLEAIAKGLNVRRKNPDSRQ